MIWSPLPEGVQTHIFHLSGGSLNHQVKGKAGGRGAGVGVLYSFWTDGPLCSEKCKKHFSWFTLNVCKLIFLFAIVASWLKMLGNWTKWSDMELFLKLLEDFHWQLSSIGFGWHAVVPPLSVRLFYSVVKEMLKDTNINHLMHQNKWRQYL